MKRLIFAAILLLAIQTLAFAQASTVGNSKISTDVLIKIVKAEDALNFESIGNLVSNINPTVRYRSILAAGRIGDKRAIPALIERMKDDSLDVRAMTAFAIGEIESIDGADAILDALQNKETPDNVRKSAVEAAGKIAAANAKHEKATALGEAILDTLDTEDNKGPKQNRDVILAGITAALRAKAEESDFLVARFLTNLDPRIRADAANTLSRLRSKNGNAKLRVMLTSDQDGDARANAARALGAAEDKSSLEILLKAATDDADLRVRVSAIRSLVSLKDATVAGKLLDRGEKLLADYSKALKPNFIPSEQNEFIEIAATLGRLLANTDNQRADKLFADFGKLDKGRTPEVYIARVRIGPKRGDGSSPELTSWRQYSTLAQIIGEFASIEPTSEVGKAMKSEAPGILRPLAKAFAEANPVTEGKNMLAGPDALRAYARFKTEDLGEIALKALTNKDVWMRSAAAGVLANLPATRANVIALKNAFDMAWETDKLDNDAQLAMLDALYKLDKKIAVGSLLIALNSPDYLVRKKAFEKLAEDSDLIKSRPEISINVNAAKANHKDNVLPPTRGFATKLGQVLNTDIDYRRALSRKNGSVKAVLTTEKGTFTIVFNPEEAPLTVDNFIKLAKSKYFDGLEVHRVVPNFVMQDGDPLGTGSGGPGWSIRCEVNMLPYGRGAVGMALSGKDTGGSQWFVTHAPQPHLGGGYTVFGHVNETGMKVVDNIVRGDRILTVKIIGR